MNTLSARSAFFRYSYPTGPITIKAGLALSCLPSNELCIQDTVNWPINCDYSDIVREEITAALLTHKNGPLTAKIQIEEIEFCPIGSSEHAFRIATKEAVRSLISITEKTKE